MTEQIQSKRAGMFFRLLWGFDLLVVAIPGLGFTLFLLMVLILQPRWN